MVHAITVFLKEQAPDLFRTTLPGGGITREASNHLHSLGDIFIASSLQEGLPTSKLAAKDGFVAGFIAMTRERFDRESRVENPNV